MTLWLLKILWFWWNTTIFFNLVQIFFFFIQILPWPNCNKNFSVWSPSKRTNWSLKMSLTCFLKYLKQNFSFFSTHVGKYCLGTIQMKYHDLNQSLGKCVHQLFGFNWNSCLGKAIWTLAYPSKPYSNSECIPTKVFHK